MSRYSWRMVFEDFKNTYPDLWKRGTSYEPSNFMEINIFIPGDGKYKYDYHGKKLTLVEKYLTIEQEDGHRYEGKKSYSKKIIASVRYFKRIH